MDRRRIASGSPYEPVIGFSRALRAGDRVLVSGTAPIWPDGSCDPDPEAQAARCLEIILAALAEAGAGPEQVVRTRMYLLDPADGEAVGRAHGAVFAGVRPAASASSRCSSLVAPTIGVVTPGLCSSQASATWALETPRSAATWPARSITGRSRSGR